MSQSTSGHQARPAAASDVIAVAVAEFASARQEMADLGGAQRILLNLNLTVSAAVFGFVLSNRVSALLLLVIPPLSAALGLLYQQHWLRTREIADYVGEDLRKIIIDHTGETRLLGLIEHQERLRRPVIRYVPAGIAIPVLFPTIPGVALAWAWSQLHSGWAWAGWSIGLLLTFAEIAAGLTATRLFLQR